jgi:hypothetical protein
MIAIGIGILNVLYAVYVMVRFELEWRAIDKEYGKL